MNENSIEGCEVRSLGPYIEIRLPDCCREECVDVAEPAFPKGESIIDLPTDYVVIDLETTGLSSRWDEIIELAAVRVRGGVPVDLYQQIVKPQRQISEFITSLTGITNEMVADAPRVWDVLKTYLDFIGDDFIVGHNVGFDVGFIHRASGIYLNLPFQNNYINTIRVARKAYPGLGSYKLDVLCELLEIDGTNHHRALADCEQTFALFEKMRSCFHSADELRGLFVAHRNGVYKGASFDARLISSTVPDEEMDHDHVLYGKNVVFTGKLERLARKDAMQLVANLGGKNQNGVTKETNFLVLGNNDYCTTIKDGKSGKQKRAEELMLKGYDIAILDEQVFYELIAEGASGER